jgi:hypothetical protein
MSLAFPDLQLHLDPQFAPHDTGAAAPGTSLVPPLSLDPSIGSFGALPPSLLPSGSPGAMTDLFGHLTDPAPGPTAPTGMSAITGAIEGLGTRPGLQADKDGVGTTLGDWKMRFMPYIPFLNEP